MLNSFLILVVLLAFSRPLWSLCRRSAYWGRKRLSRNDVYMLFGNREGVMEALAVLSEFYGIPIGFFRPDDHFTEKSRLWKYDSWSFGQGQEDLNDFLYEHGLYGEHSNWTITDFVDWYVKTVDKAHRKEM